MNYLDKKQVFGRGFTCQELLDGMKRGERK